MSMSIVSMGGRLALWPMCVSVGCGPSLEVHDQGGSVEGAPLDDPCTMWFEADGELDGIHVFCPGRACWVNRCDPEWTIHIDYCEDEDPPSCD